MRYWLILFLSHVIISVYAQSQLKLVNEFSISFIIDQSAIDKLGNYYLSDKEGTLYKLNNNGKEITRMATSSNSIASINADNSFKIFCFYPTAQQFTISNRYLSNTQEYKIGHSDIGYISHATPGVANSLWLLDISNSELIKYDLFTQTIILRTSIAHLIPDTAQITMILEHNNMVLIGDQSSGVYIFDTLGNYKSKVEESGISQYSIKDANLVHLTNDSTLHLHNIYSNELQEIMVDKTKKYRQSLVYKNTVLLITEKTVDIYRVE